jgi:hypothetical protein
MFTKKAKYYAVTAIKGAYFPTLLFNRFRNDYNAKAVVKLACINLFFLTFLILVVDNLFIFLFELFSSPFRLLSCLKQMHGVQTVHLCYSSINATLLNIF